MKQSPARIFIIAFGIVVSSSCCAQGSVSSDLSYSAGNIWGFDESSWRYNNELRYNEESYWRFELDDSRYLSIIRPSIFNGDLTKNDILGTKLIEEATTEHSDLLGEEGGWAIYTAKDSKTDNILIAAKGNQRRFYFHEIYEAFPSKLFLDSPFETYWSKAGIRLGETTLLVYDFLPNYEDPLSPYRLLATYSAAETSAIMSALNEIPSDHYFYNEENRAEDYNEIGREMGRQYRMIFADGNDLLIGFYSSQRAIFSSVDSYLYLEGSEAYRLLSAHLDLTYDPTYNPDAHIHD